MEYGRLLVRVALTVITVASLFGKAYAHTSDPRQNPAFLLAVTSDSVPIPPPRPVVDVQPSPESNHPALPVEPAAHGAHPLFVALWSSVICFILLMFIGSGDRIVVFVNLSDLLWTAGVVLIPIFGIIIIVLVGVTTLPKSTAMTWQTLADYPLFGVTVAIVGSLWSYAVIGTIHSSISFNGLVIGLLIASMKVVAATLLAVLAYSAWKVWLDQYEREGRRPNHGVVASLFAVLGWTALCLINGDRVMDYRGNFVDDYL